MIHEAPIYIGRYEIIEDEGTKYIHCFKPELKFYTFEKNRSIKKFFGKLLNLDLNDEKKILEYVNENGVLMNTQNEHKKPTYQGKPIPKRIEYKVSPFAYGVSVPLAAFIHEVELIRNIWLLNSLVGKKKLFSRVTTTADASNENVELVQLFFELLYQPYKAVISMEKGDNWVMGGNTPLARFPEHFHDVLCMADMRLILDDYIHIYNFYLLDYGQLKLQEKNQMTEEDLDKENDIDIFPYAKRRMGDKIKRFIVPVSDQFRIDSMSYIEIMKFCLSLEKYYSIKFNKDGKILVDWKETKQPSHEIPDEITRELRRWSEKLIAATINGYTSKISYMLVKNVDDEYEFKLVSRCLLFSIYLEMGNVLNHYQVTRCKYRKCNKAVISTKNKPALCCSHTHYTSYVRQLERDGVRTKQVLEENRNE